MKYDVQCPFCGAVNRGLYLEETDGTMECCECGRVTRNIVVHPFGRIPVYTLSGIPCRVREKGTPAGKSA